MRAPWIAGSALFGPLLLLAGCAMVTQVDVRPIRTGLDPYPIVVVSVESAVSEDVSREVFLLKGLTVARIADQRIFRAAQLWDGELGPQGTLLVKVLVRGIHRVSGAERYWLGILAWRAWMEADVTLVDAATGVELGFYSVKGESGGTGMSGDTRDAVRQTARGVALLLSDVGRSPTDASTRAKSHRNRVLTVAATGKLVRARASKVIEYGGVTYKGPFWLEGRAARVRDGLLVLRMKDGGGVVRIPLDALTELQVRPAEDQTWVPLGLADRSETGLRELLGVSD
jgi:hypothetical protein